MDKKKILEKELQRSQMQIEWYERQLKEAPETFIKIKLETRIAELSLWIEEEKVKIEAYELLLKAKQNAEGV